MGLFMFVIFPAGGKLKPSKIKTAANSILIELSRTVTCEENGVSTQSLDTLNSTHEIHTPAGSFAEALLAGTM